ncbi:MAG: DUF2156 domain-containing protein [Clostridia bacterium]|nr:DUF2156 domain-containing protein [Clostridia bacterium]
MNDSNNKMLKFKRISSSDRELYQRYMPDGTERGCEFSFGNLYMWGRQNIVEAYGHLILFSQFDRKSVYPYPMGKGDKKQAIDAIILDAEARGISCRITGLSAEARENIERLYPGKFRYHCDEGAFDYVYDINDLADLKGKKYHSKRNHLNRFYEAYPDWKTEPLSESNADAVSDMVNKWYEEKIADNPNSDFHMEKVALEKALSKYEQIGLEGLVLYVNDEVAAFTMGSFLSEEMIDIHFEKARSDVQGAYAAINCEFAKFLRCKYPNLKYLNREEDMGLEGLRKAKRSYKPHHMIAKCWACLLEDGYEY